MKKIFMYFFLLICSCCCIDKLIAQCPAGEIEVSIEVETDSYGYEGYWQLVPSGNACDEATIFEGGNATQIGCSGAGEQDATTAFGYGDNITITEGPWCLTEDADYDIIYVEDWGDGGFNFNVLITEEEYPVYTFTGEGLGNTFTFTASPPLDWNISANSITNYPYQNVEPITIQTNISNYSVNTINSIEMNYSINGGTEINAIMTGLNILPFTDYNLSHSTLWTPAANGEYNLEINITNLNGNADMDMTNNTKSKIIIVGDSIPDIISSYLISETVFTEISGFSDGINNPKDLDFHPILSNYELWIVNAGTEGSGGETVTIYNAGDAGQTIVEKQDGNAWHFMSLPTGIVFSQNTNFATSPGVLDANHGGGHFTGPALWSSDMDIYGEPSGGNGSHLDMIHQEPYAMGIEYDNENAFWVYNGYNNSIDWVDFVNDHGPGNDDHSDGKVRRYEELNVDYDDVDIPNHLVLDRNTNWLYIVDNGNARILRMDITSGDEGSEFTPYNEPLDEHIYMDNVIWEEYLTSGFIMPCGLDLVGNNLIVGDYENGDIIIYDISGVSPVETRRIVTGAKGLTGIKIGPDGKIWYVNALEDVLIRVDLGGPLVIDEYLTFDVSIYPNPANEQMQININNLIPNTEIRIYNMLGETMYVDLNAENKSTISLHGYSSGTYQVEVKNGLDVVVKSLVIQK